MDHIGMDVHKKESQLCILTEAGELIERRVRSEPERFAAVLGEQPRARILLEPSPWRKPVCSAPTAPLTGSLTPSAPSAAACLSVMPSSAPAPAPSR